MKALREVLGSRAVKRPRFDFRGATEDAERFRKTAVAFEDLAVAAYKAQAPLIQSRALPRRRRWPSTPSRRATPPGSAGWRAIVPAADAFDEPRSKRSTLAIVDDTHFVAAHPQPPQAEVHGVSAGRRRSARRRGVSRAPRRAARSPRLLVAPGSRRRGAAVAAAPAALLLARADPRRRARSRRSPRDFPRRPKAAFEIGAPVPLARHDDETTWAAVRRDVVARARPSRSARRGRRPARADARGDDEHRPAARAPARGGACGSGAAARAARTGRRAGCRGPRSARTGRCARG